MEPQEFFVPILLGTGRTDRKSAKVAELIRELAGRRGWRAEIFDAGELATRVTHGPKDPVPETAPWRTAAAAADGFIVVAPEYNHGYPAELKIVWDACFAEYRRKPVLTCGVSDGIFGGARFLENFLAVILAVHAVPMANRIYAPQVDKLFGADGQPADAGWVARAEKALDDLGWYLAALKAARGT